MIDHEAIIRQQFFDQSFVEELEKEFDYEEAFGLDYSDEDYDADDYGNFDDYDYPYLEDEDFIPLEYYEKEEEEFKLTGTRVA